MFQVTWLVIIWLLITAAFLLVGLFHRWQSADELEHVVFVERPFRQLLDDAPTLQLGSDINQPARDNVKNLNDFVDRLNESNRRVNRVES